MTTYLLGGCFLAFAMIGCTTTAPTGSDLDEADLQSVPLSVEIDHFAQTPDQFDLVFRKLGADPAPNAARRLDCLRVHASTRVSANDTSAVMTSQGSFDDGDAGFETNCIDPAFSLQLGTVPPGVELEISDSTRRIQIQLERQEDGSYAIKRCDAANCHMFQNIECGSKSATGFCPV
ncbi:MAG: hypothetical protein JWO36_3151 [Myxococcales bacterium]|nr:hypothetical protein [Myxococcales bacterium]